QGTNAVGAMIVAGPEGFRKNQYRKFNVKSVELEPGDDYGMMREMLSRRFKRLLLEAPRQGGGTPGGASAPRAGEGQAVAPDDRVDATRSAEQDAGALGENESPWPDLVLIDGGLGQLNA